MNGTAVMTGLACLAYARAEYLARLATRITALAVVCAWTATLTISTRHCFPSSRIRASNKWPRGCARIWAAISRRATAQRLQDRYSIRCAPHVIGVLADALPWLRESIENELNSANDNPIIDAGR